MDGLFGLGFAFALSFGLASLLPAAFILAVAFVYVRQQRGYPVDIVTGASAYTVVLIALGALLIALGVAQMLTAILAEIDADYTYGEDALLNGGDIFGPGDGFETDSATDRQERNVAAGAALFIAGALAAGAHVWLRGWLQGRASWDWGVEGAWDVLFALIIGLTSVGLVAEMLDDTLGRAVADSGSAAGSTISQMIALLALWAVYAYRGLMHTGLLGSDPEGGPGGGRPL